MEQKIKINIDKEDKKILDKYGFYYEKNMSQFLKNVANELRIEELKIKEKELSKRRNKDEKVHTSEENP